MTSSNALNIQDLYKTYTSGVEALRGINLCVKKGDFFALLGANGAGKSTTIGLISSLLKKTSGTIAINGHDLDRHPTLAKKSLGLVPQEINLNIFEKCEQILITQAGYFGLNRKEAQKRAETLLKQVGLWQKRDAIVRYLSGGMKRRLMIARALIHQPTVLLLDEPTAGVDIEIRHAIWEFLQEINEAGTTIVLTTHYLEEAEQLCDQLAIIDQGIIVEQNTIKKVLHSLHHQTFIFDIIEPLKKLPDLSPFTATLLDPNQIELRVDNHYTLNEIFAVFAQQDLKIHSMRNKTNRLEELFMDVIHHET
ncbi:MAG: ABC transporter ATP-binding protein [Legionellales bacterium]|nr:ABC transporter ATP-binding protein [Legionellales bacterium]